MRKPHLFSSDDRWEHWGIQLKALCGREVAEAHWVAALDGDWSLFYIGGIGVCKECQAIDKDNGKRRYLYVIAEGQVARDEAISA